MNNVLNNITWDIPLPLSENRNSLPCFPVESFPSAISEYIIALAENTQTSRDMAAVIALGILSVAAGRSYRIEGNANYYEPLNLYVLLVAEPGERKSSIMQNMTRFLFDYEQTENERLTVLKVLIVLEMTMILFLHWQVQLRDAKERCPTLYRM